MGRKKTATTEVKRIRQPIALTLTPELQAALARIAEVEGLSRSQFVEMAMRSFLRADARYKRVAEDAFRAA